MSLRINHNLAAMNAHRNLVGTVNSLTSSMQKLSSGFRINKGSDDPAGLVISEQFRAQIAGLNRAIGNSEGSINMIQTAEGALTEMNTLLTGMRELAIHAANEGFNDADQLAADQAEIKNAIATIDRIAANTQFGTKNLLDGTKENVATITTANTSLVTLTNSQLGTGTYALAAVKTADAAATLNTTSLGISLNNTDGDPYNLAEGIHNLDVVQASDVAKRTTDSIAITDAWGQGITVEAGVADADAVATLTAAAGMSTTGANSALGDYSGDYTFNISYQEYGGTQITEALTVTIADDADAAVIEAAVQAALDANTNLAGKVDSQLTAGVAGNQSLQFVGANKGAQFAIHTEASSTTAANTVVAFAQGSDRGISDATLDFTTVTNLAGTLTAETITVADATYTDMATLIAAINTAIGNATYASATSDIQAVLEGTHQIQIQTVDEGSDFSVTQVSVGADTEELQNVLGFGGTDSVATTGVDALVNFNGYSNTISSIKANDGGTQQTFTLGSAAIGDADRSTLSIQYAEATMSGTETGINTGNMLLTATAIRYAVQLDGGPATTATAGVNATIFNSGRSESIVVNYGLTSAGGNETISNLDQSLVFQIGGNVGQTARISLRNMASTALGNNITGNMFTSLSGIDVTTAQGAQDAQSVIDQAINEVSTTRGTLGSFQKNTLESNLRNLRVAAQNLTASESQIRDTDMAAEMSEFTKNQILMQAGTAMLAQANQVPQVVLSLFG